MFRLCSYTKEKEYELDTSDGLLEAIENRRVFKLMKEKDGDFSIMEMCDEEFAVSLTKDELIKLGEEIIKFATT